MAASVYQSGSIASSGRYYGRTYNGQGWPAIMGGSNGPHAFLAGDASTFLTGGASNLTRRAVAAYSNVSNVGSFNARLTAGPNVIAPAAIGPVRAIFSASALTSADPSPY